MIIAFTKDWNDVPTSTTHILREMAKDVPVLWVESIGTRAPDLFSRRDVGRGFRRVKRLASFPEHKENHLWVLSPFLIPGARSAATRRLNRWLSDWQIARARRRIGDAVANDTRTEFWCFVPNAVDLLPSETLGGDKGSDHRPIVIYYCVDDWSQFENLDGSWLQQKENELIKRADVTFAVSRCLEEKCRPMAGERVHYMPHGVNHALFSSALDKSPGGPTVLANLPRPVVGFYGNISAWIDLPLLAELAKRMPNWSFVLAGPQYMDVSPLKGLRNVHLPGRLQHEDLPAFCRGLDVGIIPYDMGHPRMASINPVKSREMLAAGLPIVSSDIPELKSFGDEVSRAEGVEEWVAAIEKQASRTDRKEISRRVAGDDWSGRVRQIRTIVECTEAAGTTKCEDE